MRNDFYLLFFWVVFQSGLALPQAVAQPAVNPFVVEDDTLPIANSRFDETVELPKENFSSAKKNDMWEKFERGELNAKAYAYLQKDYAPKKSKVVQKAKKNQRGIASLSKDKSSQIIKKTKIHSKNKTKVSKTKKAPRNPQALPTKLPAKKKK